MFSFGVENEKGEVLQLTGNSGYQIKQIDGLASLNAVVNTSTNAGFDGAMYNSSRIEKRNIGIYIVPQGDVEENRLALYRYFPLKRWVKLYYRNRRRDVFIEGYVEDINTDLFELNQTMQIVVVCPRPFFQDINGLMISFAMVVPHFEFPFAIDSVGIPFSTRRDDALDTVENTGDVDRGILITIYAEDTALSPAIYNADTREKLELRGLSLAAGDVVYINTTKGEKEVTLIRDNTRINVINHFTEDSSWLQLPVGSYSFTYDAAEGAENLQVSLSHSNRYVGV